MRERTLRNRLKILYQQLDLINLYPDDFIEALGEKGIEDYINETLDEILEKNTELANLKSKNKKK